MPDIATNGYTSFKTIIEELRTFYLGDSRPWLVGFSGGKDSTLVTALIFEAVLSIPAEQRTKEIHVVCTDNPVYEAMEMGFHSMVEVFLAAGLDQGLKDDLLDMAVDRKRFDLILLCQQYGARLSSVDFESVCETRNPQLIRFFWTTALTR